MAAVRKPGKRDPMSVGLALLNQLAGARLLDRLGLRAPMRKAVYEATRGGFRVAATAGRTFQAATRLGQPARMPAGDERGLFDLTPTDDQQMITAAVTDFAAEQLRP